MCEWKIILFVFSNEHMHLQTYSGFLGQHLFKCLRIQITNNPNSGPELKDGYSKN